MKKSKINHLPVLVLFLALTIVSGLVGYSIGKGKVVNSESQAIDTSPKTYSSKLAGFSFTYPYDWKKIAPQGGTSDTLSKISLISPDYDFDDSEGIYYVNKGTEISILASKADGMNLKEYSESILTPILENGYPEGTTERVLAGKKAIKYSCGHETKMLCMALIENEVLYEIFVYGDLQEKEVEKILGSFRFTEPVQL